MATKYLNVEFIATIPVKVDVDETATNTEMTRIAISQAWDEIHTIEGRDGLSNWIIASGTVEPISEDEINILWGDE